MVIRVGKKWDKNAIYIGRGSPLGNMFVMKDESERDMVCNAYEVWFNEKVKQNDPSVMQVRLVRAKRALQELRKIYKLAKQGDVVLGCYCSPKRCHGDTIKKFLDKYI